MNIFGIIGIIIGALVTGYLGLMFSLKQYRNQKVWENINKRYFENGVEDLINYLNKLRIKAENNYADALIAVSFYRDLKKEDFKDWFQKLKLKTERVPSSMPDSFFITIGMFEDNKDLGDLCIEIFVECGAINEFYCSELPLIFNKYIEDPNANNNNAEGLRIIISEKHNKIKETKIYKTIEILENLLFRLREKNIDSYKKLGKIKKDQEIKKILLEFTEIKEKSNCETLNRQEKAIR